VDAAEGEDGEAGARRSSGASPTALLIGLRTEGFFGEKREISAIVDELHKKGYGSMKSSDISGKLGQLVRKEVLKREKNEGGNWVYEAGAKDDLQ
jgi:hypothetical protein